MEGGRAVDEDLLRDLPEEYAALADRRTVMLEVAAQLKELHAAVTRLGDALEGAGLPGREWRSADARLRLLPGSLPNITIDDVITRLAEFAAGTGPTWLHGAAGDLEVFHKEVATTYAVVRRLQRIAADIQDKPARNRRSARLERAVTDARVRAALDDVEGILGDFKALRPFMAPLSRQEWAGSAERAPQPDQSSQLDARVASSPRDGLHGTLPLPPPKPHTRLRDFAPATDGGDAGRGLGSRVAALILALRRRISHPRTWSHWQKELAAIAIVLVLSLVAIGLEVAHSHPQPSGGSSGAVPTATATVPATATPRRVAPAPRLALTCSAQGSTARLTVQNVGASAVTWQAQAPSSLRVVPDHGALAVGQSATAQVSATNSRRQATGTVTVTATGNTRSAAYSVACA